MVEEELDPLLPARVGEHLQDVPPVGRAVDDVVVAHLGVVHREAVVVLRRDRDVLHARRLRHRHPGRGVVLHRVEGGREVALVLGDGDPLLVHHPLPVSRHRVDAPVDEEAEAGLLEPLARLQVLGGGRVALLGEGGPCEQGREQQGEERDASGHWRPPGSGRRAAAAPIIEAAPGRPSGGRFGMAHP